MLRVIDLTVEVGHRLLVAEASFTIAPGDVVGLVGPNGAGKTSLLRTISERAESPARPAVTLVGELAWLPQESPPTTASTGLARLLSARGLDRARHDLEEARRRIDQSPDARARDRAIKRFSGLQERFEHEGGYRAEAEARRIGAGLGIPASGLDRPLSGLSGGERRRVELARVLLSQATTLLLDEPTNHLDADAKRWLAGFLADFSGGILLVSHDLPLLDRDVTGVLADQLTASIETYKGTWTQYLEAREVRARSEAKQRKVLERDIKRLSAFVEKYRHSNEDMARRAMVTERRVEKMKGRLVPERRSGRKVAVKFPGPTALGPLPSGRRRPVPLLRRASRVQAHLLRSPARAAAGAGAERGRQDLAAAHPGRHRPARRGRGPPRPRRPGRLLRPGARGARPGGHRHGVAAGGRQGPRRPAPGRPRPLPARRRPGLPADPDPVRRREDQARPGPAGPGRHNVLLLDEPTNNLDVQAVEAVLGPSRPTRARWSWSATTPRSCSGSSPTGSCSCPTAPSTSGARTTWTWSPWTEQGGPPGRVHRRDLGRWVRVVRAPTGPGTVGRGVRAPCTRLARWFVGSGSMSSPGTVVVASTCPWAWSCRGIRPHAPTEH